MYAELYTTASKPNSVTDGRMPVDKLLRTIDRLTDSGLWERSVVYNQIAVEPGHQERTYLPIYNYRTRKKGQALWLLSGIHGEEPAGPMAIAENLAVLEMFAAQGIPVVLFGLCNPLGYYLDQRHPDANIERSVTEADHLLPHLDGSGRAREAQPATAETWAINNQLLELLEDYPPLFALDLHEDEAEVESDECPPHERIATYNYIISKLCDPRADPVAQAIAAIWRHNNIEMWKSGRTRSDEVVENGMTTINPGEGSIDELLASETCVVNGVLRPKPAAKIAITTETPTIRVNRTENGLEAVAVPVAERVHVQSLVLQALPVLWQMAQKTYI